MTQIRARVLATPRQIKGFSTDPGSLPRQIMDMAREELVPRAQDKLRAMTDTRSGELMGSHRVQPLAVTGQIMATMVENYAPHAAYVHDGTRPHVIVPRNASALRFVPKGAGAPVFAMRVNHPGTKPRPWLKEAADEVQRDIISLFR